MSTRFVSGLYSRCQAKQRFATRSQAKAAVADMRRMSDYRPGRLEVYRCDRCDGYHVGNDHATIRHRRG
jgi:hypothetical protein